MGPWWLYILVFVFGYLTHKTFYFLRSIRLSIGMIRLTQLVSLAVLARSMENFYHSHTARMRHMKENNESKQNIRDVRRSFNTEISTYKEEAIKEMIALHPKFYEPVIDFDDWKSAMTYLEKNRSFLIQVLKQAENDKKTS